MTTDDMKAAIERIGSVYVYPSVGPPNHASDLATVLALAEVGRLAVEEYKLEDRYDLGDRSVSWENLTSASNEFSAAAYAFLAKHGGEQ